MQRVQVQFTPEQLAGLARGAQESGTSVAAVVRQAVDAWLGETERRHRIENALGVVGAFRSGLGDLAERHDDYLADPSGP
jgi:hypothetical protein